MNKIFRNFILVKILVFSFWGLATAQSTGKPPLIIEETITYETAVAVWTEAQPHYWPMLRMTVDDLIVAYFRDDEGEIVKLGNTQFRAEMRGCVVTVTVDDL